VTPKAVRNWRVTRRLIILVAIPTVLGLALAGLRITDAARSGGAYRQVGRLAVLGQQVTGLAQALEDERADAAAYVAGGRRAAGLPALHRRYAITDGWAAAVRRQVRQLGGGYPAQTQASAASVLATVAEVPGLRRGAEGQAAALTVINGYSAATAGLLTVDDGIADLSGNSGLVTSVRALGALSQMKDHASQQEAILGVALAQGHFGPGVMTALAIAQAEQASDLVAFRGSATPEQTWALSGTLAGSVPSQARALGQRAVVAGPGALAPGAHAGQQWLAGMSHSVGWMRHAEQQLTDSIASYAQALQRGAVQAAIVTAAAALAALALISLLTLMIARSIVVPLRRLEAAALDVAGTGLPAEVGALGVAGYPRHRLPATPMDVQSTDEIGQVARAFDRVHREALRLAGEQARLRASVSAVSTSFLRRSHSLLDRLLRLIDSSELTEDDPERLASLFQMDHLATRMRRNTDSALAIAGHDTPDHPPEPVTLVDVLRAAVSEVEQYDRVALDVQQGVSVNGSAAADAVHLLAELLENATTFSPLTSEVTVSARTARDGGSLISITDAGTGIAEEELGQLNWQLAHPRLPDTTVGQRMGFFAVAHLAARHAITVTLSAPPDGGTSAEVHLPAALISPEVKPPAWMGPPGEVFRSGTGGRPDEPAAATDWLGTALRFAAGPEPVPGPVRESVPGPVRESVPGPVRESVPGPVRESVAPSVPEPARESVAPSVPEPAREQHAERLPSRDR
jgi:signal transduction histidine kinase